MGEGPTTPPVGLPTPLKKYWPSIRCGFRCSLRPPHLTLKILETGYSLLGDIGGEERGYGLYSYALAVNDNDRSGTFLKYVFNAVPPVEITAAQPSQTNLFYIPLKDNAAENWMIELLRPRRDDLSALGPVYAKNLYDYKMARALLDHLCDPPAEEIKAVCEGDLSRGPDTNGEGL